MPQHAAVDHGLVAAAARRSLAPEEGGCRERSDPGRDRIRLPRLPDRGADRPGWDGCRLPRLRPAAEADGGAEARSRPSWRSTSASASASPARRSSPCRSSTRTSCRSTTPATSTVASTSRCASSRERICRALLRAEGALEPGPRARDLPPGRERPRCGTREGSRASRRQAVQRAPRRGRARLSRRLRADAAARGAGRPGGRRSLGRDARLPRPRADRGRARRRARGRLLARLSPLRVPHRRGPVRPRLTAGGRPGRTSRRSRRARASADPDLPEAIDAVLRKAMAKSPDERYATCAALIEAAEAAFGIRSRPRRRRRLVVAALGAATLAAVASARILLGGGDATPTVVPDSLVKIDLESDKIVDVVPVGRIPTPRSRSSAGTSSRRAKATGP